MDNNNKIQEERLLNHVTGSVVLYDQAVKNWKIAGTSSGLSSVRILYNPAQNIFRIHGQKISQLREVVLDCQITREIKYNRSPTDAFVQWHDSRGTFWGINFRAGSRDAVSFFDTVVYVLRILNGHATLPESNGPLQVGVQPNQQQSNPAPITQGPSIGQQPMRQQAPQQQQQQQQPILHQQQQQLLAQQQQSQPQMLSHIPPTQLAQQQQQAQQQVSQSQQQQQQQHQLHQYMQQATPPQPDMNQINHYQPQQTNNIIQPPPQPQQQPPPQQQQQQHQYQQPQHMQPQQVQQQQQQQPTPVSAAPIPPPPPPPPPAPPMAALTNSRINGTSGATTATTNNHSPNNLQHSPVANNNFVLENGANRNGGSPNQAVSLASELAKCQLRKVNRSDSDKESECNNNNIIAHPKTTRAASLANCQAFATDNLMNDLKGKLASRRERIDQQGDSPASLNSGGAVSNTNGIGTDKSQESWLADIIRKEISQQLNQMKSEIIDAIKTELRQR